MSSNYTKITRLKLWAWRIVDWVFLFLPAIVYVFIALFEENALATQKFALVSCLVVALILTCLNIVAQKRLRCPLWIILIGLFIVIRDKLMPLVVILALVTTLDDLVFTPLISYYHTKLIASKAIDEREEENGRQ